jgi:predicted permease
MHKEPKSFADRCYRALLRILPFDFRVEFGSEMEAVFQEQRTEVNRERGITALFKMWWQTILDIFRLAPREHWNILSMDARYAIRTMRKSPAFTISAILILGLGIGANTAIFSVVNSVLLKPLPYIDGDRLVILRQPETKLNSEDVNFSVPEIRDYRERTGSLSKIVEYHNMTFTLYGKGAAHRVRSGVVSSNFFDVFGVRPLLGRTFVTADERHGAEPVLILSHEFWQQIEGGKTDIVGKTYEMNDRVHTVIGVLPPIPQYPDENDVYMPTTSCPMRSDTEMMADRNHRMMNLFGRLKDNQTLGNAQSDVAVIAQQLRKEDPKSYPENSGIMTTVSLLRDDLTRDARPLLLMLWGAAGFVLLITCANVANLILSRMSQREQELMIRTAVGAGSGRLLRQLLTESFFLTLLAAIVGILFAFSSIELMKEFAGQITSRAREITIDPGVLAFAVLCAAATTIFFGSIAALSSRQDLASGLKEAGRTSSEKRSNVIRRVLIAAQVAFSFVLLIGAGLMVRSFLNIIHVNPGFATQSVYAVRLNLNGDRFDPDDARRDLGTRIIQKLSAIRGVMSVGVGSSFPLDQDNLNQGSGRPLRFQVEGDWRSESELPPVTTVRAASPDYFKTLKIPTIMGRTFLDSDNQDAPLVVLLNQTVARRRFGNENPVGKRITANNGETWMTIVGVVGDVKESGLARETPYQIYRPFAQVPFLGSTLVRASGPQKEIVEQIRRGLREVEPLMAIVRVQTMEEARAKSIASPRTLTRLFTLFAVLALIIAVAGVGSMLALGVRQRNREIGIRMALGATPRKVLTSIISQGMLLVMMGLVVGLAVALMTTTLLSALLFQVTPTHIPTYFVGSMLLLCAAFLACYLPARRASNIDPQVALRCE